jgi:hypothetical protein
LKDAISQYDETRELKEDLTNDIQDKIYEWQDNNYEQLQYKLEVEIDTNEAELEVIEYYLNRVENDLFSVAEVYVYLNQQS